jgi:hypothetical protein
MHHLVSPDLDFKALAQIISAEARARHNLDRIEPTRNFMAGELLPSLEPTQNERREME